MSARAGRAPLVLLLLASTACSPAAREGGRAPAGSAPDDDAAAATIPDAAAATLAPMSRLAVTLYYPSASADRLIGEPHEIFETSSPGDRVKQIVADLISGPLAEGAASALPRGTLLRQVYVLPDGTAYLDFSPELKEGLGGGSALEQLAVYSIVNSVALNVPEVRRVVILISGQPVGTLNGHLDLTHPLPPRRSLIASDAAPAPG